MAKKSRGQASKTAGDESAKAGPSAASKTRAEYEAEMKRAEGWQQTARLNAPLTTGDRRILRQLHGQLAKNPDVEKPITHGTVWRIVIELATESMVAAGLVERQSEKSLVDLARESKGLKPPEKPPEQPADAAGEKTTGTAADAGAQAAQPSPLAEAPEGDEHPRGEAPTSVLDPPVSAEDMNLVPE